MHFYTFLTFNKIHYNSVPNIVNVNVSSSSAAERNWSTYDFIHNKKRNRLTEDRARDLVYVHSNLRLLENIQAMNYIETTVEWEQWAFADSDSE